MNVSREEMDRALVAAQSEQLAVICRTHPKAAVTAIYSPGTMRILCRECGFEVVAVKVA